MAQNLNLQDSTERSWWTSCKRHTINLHYTINIVHIRFLLFKIMCCEKNHPIMTVFLVLRFPLSLFLLISRILCIKSREGENYDELLQRFAKLLESSSIVFTYTPTSQVSVPNSSFLWIYIFYLTTKRNPWQSSLTLIIRTRLLSTQQLS